MKPLLIAMGDSWTYGLGIYDADALAQYELDMNVVQLNMASDAAMQVGAWPAQLARLLDWDLINLAAIGASNSGQAKKLINELTVSEQYRQVTVIWMLTASSRFSFYTGKNHIENFNPTHRDLSKTHSMNRLQEEYVNCISNELGERRETEFYLKAVSNYCQVNGYEFNYMAAWELGWDTYELEGNLAARLGYATMKAGIDQLMGNRGYAHCWHPNLLAHGQMARDLYRMGLLDQKKYPQKKL